MTDTAIVPAESKLDLALLKAVGLDRAAPEQRQLALNIADRYSLDLLLKHLVLIEGRPYITRDGLLHVAHRSGVLDGIEVTDPVLADGYWRATCSVFRKDMGRPFTYSGRYPEKGGNAKFAPEMAVKVAEVMALRRAFDVSAPVVEERWDLEGAATEPPAPRLSAREIAAAKAQEVVAEAAPGGLTAPALASLARDAGKTKAQLAQAIAMVRGGAVPSVTDVSDIVRAMSPEELRLLAVELNLDLVGAA